MKGTRSVIFLIFMIVAVSCVPRRKTSDIIPKFTKNGEAIATDKLIQQYEREHLKIYTKETKKGDQLEWPTLDGKILSNFCRKYLQYLIPKRKTDGAIGITLKNTLHYKKENTSIISKIVMVQCKIWYARNVLSYFMTRAPEPNCVYSLNCRGIPNRYICAIIHKQCDFEDKPLIKKCLKWKGGDSIGSKHRKTGQPVAKDEYLLKYELDHDEMFKNREKEGKYIEWPHAMNHHNLNLYCYQYLAECSPDRNREDVIGSIKYEKLHYRKLNTDDEIIVTTVACLLPQIILHMTRAPEVNCVYALLRLGHNIHDSLAIIFKHCDFEDPLNDQQSNIHAVGTTPRRKINDTIQKFTYNGEAIAVNHLIQQYEKEHQIFCNEKSEDDDLVWPSLDNNYLSNYCRKYLQHCIFGRKYDDAIGTTMKQILLYEKENTSITNEIVIVQCKTSYKSRPVSYYITRAPEPNCVYSLKCTRISKCYTCIILHKHCDFEEKPFINKTPKRMRIQVKNRKTGQPIAKDEHLLQYELEHQQMLKESEIEGKGTDWPYAMEHHNLNLYCYQYLEECAPNRNREGVTGMLRIEKLYYWKLDTDWVIDVTTVTCLLPYGGEKRHYYLTRAPETNCVYALLRKGCSVIHPLVIVFKLCNFEYPPNDHPTSSQHKDIINKNVIPKTGDKEDTFAVSETLPFSPTY